MHKDIIIERRFNGPPISANGGYAAGVLFEAMASAGPVSVGLKAPPPVDQPLSLEKVGAVISMLDGETVVAEATNGVFSDPLPDIPADAEADFDHPLDRGPDTFDGCYVCGRARSVPEGLCIYSYPVKGAEGWVVADWTLHAGLSDDGLQVAHRQILAALDCPGYYACSAGEPALLARITAEITAPLSPDGTARVYGYTRGVSGRKRSCGTLVVSDSEQVIARAEAVWVSVSSDYLAKIAGLA